MPKNNRPGTFFGDWDPEWKGSTQTERKLAQNQYDLQVQLEQLNNKLNNTSSKRDITYIDYALLTKIDRNEFAKYTSIYNQKVINETPNIIDISQQQRKLEENIQYNESNRDSIKTVSYCLLPISYIFQGLLCAFLYFGRGLDTIISIILTVVTIIGITWLWVFLTNIYINVKYGTQKQDEQKLSKLIDKKIMSPTYKKFREFRLKHYNRNTEMLLKEYTVNSIKEYYEGWIDEDEVYGYGTPEDYMNYLKENFEE